MKRTLDNGDLNTIQPETKKINNNNSTTTSTTSHSNPISNSDIVVLDVGGKKFKTTKTTLCGVHINFFSGIFGVVGVAV